MKKSSLIITVTALLLLVNFKVVAQAPQLINYQAVARDLSGNALVSTPVNVVYDIRQSTSTGTVVYSETHSLTTNQFGLFTAEIGGGTPVVGTFPGINWSTSLYYLQVTINGDVMPATQLLSVPYALHANTATSGTPGANGHANLADSVAEPAGVNCANGGYLIHMGADDDDDGVLQPLERDISYYICNGLDGSANNNDTDATNELQTLSISNDTIYLTNGGFVPLPSSTGLWNTNANGIDYTAGNVGIGTTTPLSVLSVNSSDSIISWFSGSNPDLSAIAITNAVPGAAVGTILLAGGDTGYFAIDPTQKLMIIRNTTNGGHIAIDADSTIASYANNISQVATDFIFNNTDTIFNISPTGNIINVNQGTFLTDSLHVFGANSNQLNWVLANDGAGHAEWTDPSTLSGGGSLWTQGTGDVYNTTDSIGIGVANPSALLHVAGGGLGLPIALFEKGGFFNASIDINNTSSNGSGINFQNGGATTSSITSSTGNVLSLTSQFVEVGTTPQTGKLNVASSSTVSNPTLLLHETSTGYSRIKHTNTVAGGKYWIAEAGLNSVDANSGYSIAYNDGSSTKIPFIIYGDNKVGINNLNAPLGIFHVMDDNGSYSIFEGMNQPGEIQIARSNQPAFTRQAILNGENIGNVTFAGATGTTFGSGPQISARATENFTSTSNGSELLFKTVANGTFTHQDALRLLNDGTVEVPINLRVLNGAGNAGDVLTSDAAGNATWQTLSGANSNDTSLVDADGDTYILLDSSPDQDVIHFNLGNTTGYPSAEYFTMVGPRLDVINSGGSVFIGEEAGKSDNLANNQNVFIGSFAGELNTVGQFNTAIGSNALNANTSADHNTAIGANALVANTTGNANTSLGSFTLSANQTGNLNVAIGRQAMNISTSGSSNVAIGYQSLLSNTIADNNVGIGSEALRSNNTGANNVAIGRSAFYGKTSGGGNVAIGSFAGSGNLTGSGNVFVGSNSGQNETGSDKLYIENSNSSTPLLWGDFANDSLKVYGTLSVIDGTEGVNKVLTSDALGNASWQTPSVASSPWTQSGTYIIQTTLSDNVGIGMSAPAAKLHVTNNAVDHSIEINNTHSTANHTRLISASNSGTGSGDKFGAQMTINGSGGNNNYGFYSTVSNASIANRAYSGIAYASGTSTATGIFADAGGSGSGTTYGVYGQNSSSATGVSYGGYFRNMNSQGSIVYGVRTEVTGAATNDQYGFRADVSGAASTNTRYGIYARVINGATNWAAYFANGNVYVNDSVGIGTTSPSEELEVIGTTKTDNLRVLAGAGNVGDVLTSDAAGNASWQSPSGGSSVWTKSGGDIFQTTLTDFIGVGTNTPTEMLSIGSQGTATGTAAQQSSHGIAFTGSFWNGGGVVAHDFTIHNEASTSVNEEGRLSFIWSGSGSEVFSISSQGRIGIGTSNPISPLNIIYTGNDLEGGLVNYTQTSATANGTGFYTSANVTGTGEIIGGGFQVRLSGNSTKSSAVYADNIATSNLNIGIESTSLGTGTSSTNLGGYFEAAGGLNNHAIQLVDGTEGAGNVLTSDATGTASWKPNAVGFEVRGSTNQNVDNTPALLQYDLIMFDDGGNFDPTSGNYSFTAPIGGVYSFQTNVLFDYSSAGPNDVTVVEILKGGSPIFRSNTPIENGERATNTHSVTFKLDVGDVIQVRVYLNSGGGIITTGAADEVLFSGHLVYAD